MSPDKLAKLTAEGARYQREQALAEPAVTLSYLHKLLGLAPTLTPTAAASPTRGWMVRTPSAEFLKHTADRIHIVARDKATIFTQREKAVEVAQRFFKSNYRDKFIIEHP